MVIDLILDRKDGKQYRASDFYRAVCEYGDIGHEIAEALDNGEESDVKKALCFYILGNDYNPDICAYVDSVDWLVDELQEERDAARFDALGRPRG